MKEAHILIVDDDVLTLRIMKFMLEKEYSTATASLVCRQWRRSKRIVRI